MPETSPIAIVGISALFPGSTDGDGFWRDILAGTDLFGEIPPSRWLIEDYYDDDPGATDHTYARRGGFVPELEFEPVEFGVPPNNLPATDTSQLLTLILARRLLEDAVDGPFEEVDREKIGVILGVAGASELSLHMAGRMQRPVVERTLREHGLDEEEIDAISERFTEMYVPWQEKTFPGLLGNVVAGRVANRFDLGGTNCTVDAACGSSLAALEAAVHQLRTSDAEMMITGGVDVLNDIVMHMCFGETGALSREGDCRPFSSEADGTLLAEGIGLFALKKLPAAERDDDSIYAVVRGIGSSSDGRAKSIYAPRPEGQARALRRAYREAGYSPRTVELLEAHGTATTAGDAAEMEGLRRVFESEAEPISGRAECAVGSVKSQIGHAKAAAGAAGLYKAIRSLHHGVLPPTAKVDEPNPELEIDETMFSINTEARPWIRGSDRPRRAAVSAFGFGGTNFHVALEEYDGPGRTPAKARTFDHELILLAAPEPAELVARCESLRSELTRDGLLPALARSSQRRFDAELPCRLALVADGEDDLWEKLERAAGRIESHPATSFSTPNGMHYGHDESPGAIALLFPGQGSQYPGMGGPLAMHFRGARRVWDRAADLEFGSKRRLHDVVFPPPPFGEDDREANEDRLTATQWAQPAIGAVSASMLRLLESVGVEPSFAAGHSYGELAALHAAGALDEKQLLRVSRRRGELMAEASDAAGAMLAVRADVERLRGLLDDTGSELVVANHNAPRQAVLSGAEVAIDSFEEQLQNRDLSHRRLPVSTAFHSPLVADSTDPFLEFLGAVSLDPPEIPVLANADAAPYPHDEEAIRETIAEQIARPVRFADQVRELYDRGVRTFLEVGPGDVLSNLVERTVGRKPHRTIPLDREASAGLESFWTALGRLAVAGCPIALDALWEEYAEPSDPRRASDEGFHVEIGGANVGKPYPPEEPPSERPGKTATEPPPDRDSDDTPDAEPKPTEADPEPVERAEDATEVVDFDRHRSESGAGQPEALAEDERPRRTGRTDRRATEQSTGSSDYIPAASPRTRGAERRGRPEPAADTAPREPSTRSDGPPVESDEARMEAYRELQRQTVRAHRAYQEEMAQTHRAFLDTMQQSLAELEYGGPDPAESVDGGSPERPDREVRHQPAPKPPARSGTPPDRERPSAASEAPEGDEEQAQLRAADGANPSQDEAPGTGVDAPESETDVESMLLSVVSEKMGYPAEMLKPEMDLESDLGVDSIKQAEILSEMEDRLPHPPDLDPEEVAELESLAEIVEYTEYHLDDAP